MKMIKSEKAKLKTKRAFIKQGTCSRTFFFILNREFGHPLTDEEQAADLLAGGIIQQGYQCGMLWGASMAVGAESFRREEKLGQAIGLSIKATQHIMKSFVHRTKSTECEDITKTDFQNKWGLAKYMLSGKFVSCFILAGKWAPEAIEAAYEGLSVAETDLPQESISCASEVARRMGASDEEMAIVAGLAGGLGLSGSGCGALATAIWMNSLIRIRNQSIKTNFSDPVAKKILNAFYEETNYEMECNKICGQKFKTVEDHTEFIKNGGCNKLMDVLADISTIQ